MYGVKVVFLTCLSILGCVSAAERTCVIGTGVTDPCAANPCKNGGKCKVLVQATCAADFTCDCTAGYEGKDCSTPPEWISKACSSDSDCGQPNAKCFKSKCLCAFGFYYSLSRRACTKCAPEDLKADSYLLYPSGGINGYNQNTKTATLDVCKETCSKDPKCLNFEIRGSDGLCHSHYVVMTTSNWGDDATWTSYQKNCV